MPTFDDIKKYLPQYLSNLSQNSLFEEIKSFTKYNIQNLYSYKIFKENTIYQGDGINSLTVVNLPSKEMREVETLILSNTCDIYPDNERYFESRMVYAPILKLDKYIEMLKSKGVEEKELFKHVDSIKKQRVSQIFYLPKGQNLEVESIAIFDRLNNCPINYIEDPISERKLFSLNNFGFYLFLIKLSIHFTRIREGIDRN